MMCANCRIDCEPMVLFVCLHFTLPDYHHYAEDLTIHSVECVFKIKPVFSTICHAICELDVFSLPISLSMIVRICVLYRIIIIKSEGWPICHCLGLGYETICAVCQFILLWIYIYVCVQNCRWSQQNTWQFWPSYIYAKLLSLLKHLNTSMELSIHSTLHL